VSDFYRTPPPDPGGSRSEFARVLPAQQHGPQLSWWGTIMGLIAVGMILAATMFAYAYLMARAEGWPPAGVERPGLLWPTVATGVLLVSLVPATIASLAGKHGRGGAMQTGALATALLGVVHLVIQGLTYRDLPMDPTEGAYGSLFVLNLAVHHLILLAAIVGFLMLAVQIWGEPGERQKGGARGLGLWWQVTTVYWLGVYGLLYLSPLIFQGGPG
jgi:cytochrome c oxidase subunit III